MKAKYFFIYIVISLPLFLVFYKLNDFAFLTIGLTFNIIILKILNKLESTKEKVASNNLEFHDAKDYAPLIEVISDGIICVSSDNKILFQNIKLNRLLKNRELKFYTIDELPKEIIENIQSSFISSNSHLIKEFHFNDKVLDVKFTPIIKNSKVLSTIISFKDISSTFKLQKLKTELISNISHEFKTPLTSIQGYSELLLENSNNLNDVEKKYLNKILTNSNKLISIYEDLLSLSEVENQSDLKKENFNIKEFSEKIFNGFESDFPKKKSNIHFNLSFSTLVVNTNLFERVLNNLFENSFKYSGDELSIDVTTQIEGPNKILKIKDNGIGIQKKKRAHIFQRFYRVDEARSGDIKGLGLGLSIVKNIIEKHSGIIQVGDSESGCLITIILPKD